MEINLIELDLASLQKLQGGAVFQQVQKLIASAVTDCENRCAEDRPRVVTLKLSLKPLTRTEEIDDTHTRKVLDGIKLNFEMDLKCPTRRSIEFDCGVGDGHSLLFNPDSPHNHRQAGLPFTVDSDPNIVAMSG